jgi:hypothetical protein
MDSRNAWRWVATPFAAFAGLVGAYVVLSLLSAAIYWLIPQTIVNAALRPDLRAGIFGATLAIVTVISGCIVAPSWRGIVGIAVFAGGAWLAWQVLGSWYFPEGHPRAYQESLLPYALTIVGGIIAVLIVWRADGLPFSQAFPRR